MEEREGESFLKFQEVEGCREKSKEMGESGVMWIDDVALWCVIFISIRLKSVAALGILFRGFIKKF